ncbi:MAG TPA: hypothetical protein PLN49_00005, partial [Ferruginibacter sp.]|nr:hypothetical protein [Ferruginibacter sp.]
MSYRKERAYLQQTGSGSSYVTGVPEESLRDLFTEILEQGVHGFCFSLYEEGQKPGDTITEEQVRRRMQVLKP